MQKRGLLLLILIASISFVSAQMGIGDFLDAFGGENLLLLGSFVISFILLNFILGRLPMFKSKSSMYPYEGGKNRAVPGVIAFILSLFIVYGINKFDIDLVDIFSNIGVGEELLGIIATIAVLAGLGYLFWKFKSWVILILGVLLFVLSLIENLFFEQEIIMTLGIALIILWILIKIFTRKKKVQEDYAPVGVYDDDRTARKAQEQAYKSQLKAQKIQAKQERVQGKYDIKSQKIAAKQAARQRKTDLRQQKLATKGQPSPPPSSSKDFIGPPKATPTRRVAKFYLSFRHRENLIFNPGENAKTFRIGNHGGGVIKWKAHALPPQLISISPNKGNLKANQTIEPVIKINRKAIPPGTTMPITAIIGITTLQRKTGKAKFSARIIIN